MGRVQNHASNRIMSVQRNANGDANVPPLSEADAAAAAKVEASLGRSALVFFAFLFVVVPLFVTGVAAFFGLIMMWAEDWTYINSFYYVIGNLLGLANPLTGVNPTSNQGKFFDIVISLWALCVAGTIIGIVGSMNLINILVTAVETKKFTFGGKGDLRDVVEAVTSRGEGLSFEDFWVAVNIDGPHWPEDLARRVFDKLDVDKSGMLGPEEVERVKTLREFMGPNNPEV